MSNRWCYWKWGAGVFALVWSGSTLVLHPVVLNPLMSNLGNCWQKCCFSAMGLEFFYNSSSCVNMILKLGNFVTMSHIWPMLDLLATCLRICINLLDLGWTCPAWDWFYELFIWSVLENLQWINSKVHSHNHTSGERHLQVSLSHVAGSKFFSKQI
jgi:hypothetical protein